MLWHRLLTRTGSRRPTLRTDAPRRRPPRLEALEDRWLPAIVTWINAAGGNWQTASNWAGGKVPGAADDVIIDLPGVVVRFSQNGMATVRSLNSSQKVDMVKGTLQLDGDSRTAGLLFGGGTITTATTFAVGNDLTWTIGKFSGTGKIQVGGSLSVSTTGTKTLDGVELSTFGVTTWTAGRIRTASNATFKNEASGIITITGGTRLDPVFTNYGRVTLDVSSKTQFGTVANRGNVILAGGTFSAGTYTQDAGQTVLAGGRLDSKSAIVLNAGVLAGQGTVNASVVNAGGIVQPGAGNVLTVTGNYTQNIGGALSLTVAAPSGTPASSHLVVTGTASLDGKVNAVVTGVPVDGQQYDLVIARTVTGQFSQVDTSPTPGWNLSVVYAAKSVGLKAVAAPLPAYTPTPTPTPTPTGGGSSSSGTGGTVQSSGHLDSTSFTSSVLYASNQSASRVEASGDIRGSTNSESNSTAAKLTQVAVTGGDSVSPTSTTVTTHGLRIDGVDAIRFLLTPVGSLSQTTVGFSSNTPLVPAPELTGNAAMGRNAGSGLSSARNSAGSEDVTELADALFAALPLKPPEIDLPSEDELLSSRDIVAELLVGGRARANILPQAGGQLSAVATLVSGEETAVQGGDATASPLTQLLVDPLGVPTSMSWTPGASPEQTALAPEGGLDVEAAAPPRSLARATAAALTGTVALAAAVAIHRDRRGRTGPSQPHAR